MGASARTGLGVAAVAAAIIGMGSSPAAAAPVVNPGQTYDVLGAHTMCTITVTGYGAGGEPRAITAGHCGGPGAEIQTNAGAHGRFIHSVVDPGRGLDYGVIEFDPGTPMGNMAKPVFQGHEVPTQNLGSVELNGAMPVTGIPVPGTAFDGIGTILIKDGGGTARQVEVQVYNDGNRVYYVGLRLPGDSGASVRTLDGRVVAVHNHEAFNGVVISYGTQTQAAIDDFNRAGTGGFLPFFG